MSIHGEFLVHGTFCRIQQMTLAVATHRQQLEFIIRRFQSEKLIRKKEILIE